MTRTVSAGEIEAGYSMTVYFKTEGGYEARFETLHIETAPITLLAQVISPIMTDLATAYLSLIGSLLIFCVGLNLVWGKKVRVANMLPAVLLAVAAAYIPWSF